VTPLRVMHLANHGGRNIGNGALISGLEHVLSEDIPRTLAFSHEPWDAYSRLDRRFDAAFVERVNATSDVLLIGAAVSFDGSAHYESTGFRFDLPLELWDRLEVPLVFYGLSNRAWPRKPYYNRDRLQQALERIVTDPRILFAARNDGTKEWLESMLGRPSDAIGVVPDPALYVRTEDAFHPELVEGERHVLVAVNAEDEDYRWAVAPKRRTLQQPAGVHGLRGRIPLSTSWGWREARHRFLGELAAALDKLVAEEGVTLVLCPHDVFDVPMSYELWERLAPRSKQHAVFTSAALDSRRSAYFYDLYTKVDLAIGMRIHSMNPAVGLGTPVVPVTTQGRMTRFMADAGLSDLCVDALAADAGERIHAAAAEALAEPAAQRARLADATARARERTAAFDRLVAEHVGAR